MKACLVHLQLQLQAALVSAACPVLASVDVATSTSWSYAAGSQQIVGFNLTWTYNCLPASGLGSISSFTWFAHR